MIFPNYIPTFTLSQGDVEDRLPEPITLQTRQNSIGKFLCTMRL